MVTDKLRCRMHCSIITAPFNSLLITNPNSEMILSSVCASLRRKVDYQKVEKVRSLTQSIPNVTLLTPNHDHIIQRRRDTVTYIIQCAVLMIFTLGNDKTCRRSSMHSCFACVCISSCFPFRLDSSLLEVLQMDFGVEELSSPLDSQVIIWRLELPSDSKNVTKTEGAMTIYTTQRDFVGLAPLVMVS